MTITQFIEKAIEGGYKKAKGYYGSAREWYLQNNIDSVLLDPLAWQAACESGIPETHGDCNYRTEKGMQQHVFLMHNMIDALAEGKTIEEFLATL